MTAYLKTLIGAVMLVSLLCSILPKDGAGKYAYFASGLIVLSVIISPVLKMGDLNIIQLSKIKTEDLSVKKINYIMDEFEKNLALKVEENIEEDIDVTIYAETDDEGLICGVEKVEIIPFTEEYAEKISRLLKIDKTKVVDGR